MRRRLLCGSAVALCLAPRVQAEPGLALRWFGRYSGAIRFYRSIPLHDIDPSPARPAVDHHNPDPIALHFAIRARDGGTTVWLRIDGGPMQTAEAGETLHFGPAVDGFAPLIAAEAKPAPRSASLQANPDWISTEALFRHADGTFWRRHFTARFAPAGIDLIVWVFDAAGTRARTWRGSAAKQE